MHRHGCVSLSVLKVYNERVLSITIYLSLKIMYLSSLCSHCGGGGGNEHLQCGARATACGPSHGHAGSALQYGSRS